MGSIPRPEIELTELNREIERLEAEEAVLSEQRRKRAQAARRANWWLRYLQIAALLRRSSAKWEWWRLALLLVGPGLVGILLFVIVVAITASATLALLAFLIAGAAALAAFASFLFHPGDSQLPTLTEAAASQTHVAAAHWKESVARSTETHQRLTQLREDRRANMASGRVQRAALLQRSWKMMPSDEWADYIVEVCRTLGGNVERRARVGDREELLVQFDKRNVALLAVSSTSAINSEMVHQALDFQARSECESCAIITNGRVTGAAQDFAAKSNCRIIGREDFPDFVVGTTTI